ncbi:DUF4192 domain-containing protein [Kitasatospora sp. RB6PN24]|uniref:DUF4192 family protein n=1 Tax=Kitasatospora humi TaxID=2893891 RepID=UPI001E2961BF|nr:DUF4192 family protein [Kitasatospora humi]MCC9309101.1 DUF4192 domain-containing protein [Kitasatospora humi]
MPTNRPTPADLAALLPDLFETAPQQGRVVVVGLTEHHRPGAVVRSTVPTALEAWPVFAEQMVDHMDYMHRRNSEPALGAALFIHPAPDGAGETADRDRHALLARHLAGACRRRGIDVVSSLHWSGNSWQETTEDDDAAAGSQANAGPGGEGGSEQQVLARLTGPTSGDRADQLIDAMGAATDKLDQELADRTEQQVTERMITLLDRTMAELVAHPEIDQVSDDLAAQLAVAVLHGDVLDAATGYVEPAELRRAEELWAQLARACVGPFEEFAAAPLMLFAHARWMDGDLETARTALLRAKLLRPDHEPIQMMLSIMAMQTLVGLPEGGQAIVHSFREQQRAARAARRAASSE